MSFDLKLSSGDIELSGGSPVLVQNKDKLVQDALKILFTTTGESQIHPWYGTPLLARVVGQSALSEVLRAEVSDAVNYGLNNLKTLQQLQEQDNQFVTPQELIANIIRVDARLNEIDKRRLVVTIEIQARSNELIAESFTINI